MLRSSRYFSTTEMLEASGGSIPAELHENANRTVERLDEIREIAGIPLKLTSLARSKAHNVAIGGAEHSDHLEALAGDVAPWPGYSWDQKKIAAEWARREKAGQLEAWDQFITYPLEPGNGHIHAGFGARKRRQMLVKVAEGYEVWTAWAKRNAAPIVGGLVLVFFFVWLGWKRRRGRS